MIDFITKHLIRFLSIAALVTAFAAAQSLLAQSSEHLVSPTDLQKAAVSASQKRLQNRQTIERFFSSDKAQEALRSAKINPQKVEESIATLSDAELSQLASKATKAQNDFAAGSISNRSLLLIIVAVAALILIIVAVR